MSDDLLELADRCEKATGPDYDLSCLIGETVGVPKQYQHASSLDPGHLNYTASLDAAMTLASEIRHIEWCEGFVEAVVWREPDHCYFHTAKAATPALALCAAALRARASGEQTKP